MADKLWARVNGAGIVDATVSADASWEPGEQLPAEFAHDVTAVSGLAVGWTFNGSTFAAPIAPPLTPAQLLAYAKGAHAARLAQGVTVNVAASGAPPIAILCDGTNATRADLALFNAYGTANPTGTKQFLDNNGVATMLTGVELVALATLVATWIEDTYVALATLMAGIGASPPTITTTAQIDAAMAAVTA